MEWYSDHYRNLDVRTVTTLLVNLRMMCYWLELRFRYVTSAVKSEDLFLGSGKQIAICSSKNACIGAPAGANTHSVIFECVSIALPAFLSMCAASMSSCVQT